MSSCSIIDACFNSHLATSGRKYDNYGGGKSGAKSYSHKKSKSSKNKEVDYSNEHLPSHASNVARPSVTYTKEQLKAIKKQNKHFYKMNKGGKGKFRYPYQIKSPYDKEAETKEDSDKVDKDDKKKKKK